MSGVCLVDLVEVQVKGGGDGRGLGGGGCEVKAQAGVLYGFCGAGAETSDAYVALLEVGEVLHQGIDTRGREEEKHVIVECLAGKVVAYRAVEHGLGIVDVGGVKHGGVDRLLVHVGNGVKELFLVVLGEHGHHVVELAGAAVENLAFAVYDVFLQVEGYGLCGAEIFHGVGDADAHLLAKAEEVVDGGTCGENHGGVLAYIYFLLAEFPGAQALNFDEGTKYQLYAMLRGDVEVGRFLGTRLGLGYKNFPYVHFIIR